MIKWYYTCVYYVLCALKTTVSYFVLYLFFTCSHIVLYYYIILWRTTDRWWAHLHHEMGEILRQGITFKYEIIYRETIASKNVYTRVMFANILTITRIKLLNRCTQYTHLRYDNQNFTYVKIKEYAIHFILFLFSLSTNLR